MADTTYITAAEVKAKSRVEGIAAESDENLEKLIEEAEDIVDAHCGFWEKAIDMQTRLFPRLDDDGIPKEVSQATLAMVEQLYLIGAPQLSSEATEERIGDYSYKKTASAPELIPKKAKFLLRGFRKLTGKINLKTEK
jgi:hypothetical protein